MVESKLTYEECRRQRVEENKKRMEELNLSKLAQALKPSIPKSTQAKEGKSRARLSTELSSLPLRKSGRMAGKPSPNYKEVKMEPLGRIKRSYQRQNMLDRIRASDKVRRYAIERAEKLESELDSEYPAFIKPMLHSHVSSGFWLGLPFRFCKKYLPLEDEMITLVDEDGDESQTKYLADRTGLSGGWRGFSIDHKLADGDALIFQLVKPTQFKVYIIRAHQSDKGNNKESKENSEESDVTPSSRRGKKKRARQSDEDDGDDDDDDDDNEEKYIAYIDVVPSSRSTKRTRTRHSGGDDNKNSKKYSGKNAGRTRARKK